MVLIIVVFFVSISPGKLLIYNLTPPFKLPPPPKQLIVHFFTPWYHSPPPSTIITNYPRQKIDFLRECIPNFSYWRVNFTLQILGCEKILECIINPKARGSPLQNRLGESIHVLTARVCSEFDGFSINIC